MMHKPERKDLNWKERLMFAVIGAFTAIYGYGQILRGKPIYANWRGQIISAQFVIFLGVVFLFISVFPWSRIHFLWETGRKKRFR